MIDPTLRYYILKSGVEQKELGPCLTWAFGKNKENGEPIYKTLPLFGTLEAWNKIHAALFIITSSNPIDQTIERIGKEYLKSLGVRNEKALQDSVR